MNWRAGLLRLWIVGSICWASYQAWRYDVLCPLLRAGTNVGGGYHVMCGAEVFGPLEYYGNLVANMMGVPLLAGIRAQGSGQVAPRCARAQDPEDAVEDPAVIYSRYPAR